MYRFFLAAVDVIPAAVILVPFFLILSLTVYRRNWKKCVFYCLFSLYMATVFSLVGIPNVTYVRFELNLNLIPFVGIAGDFKNSCLNVLLFIPMGFFLPVLWRKFRRAGAAILFGTMMSLVIELLQIFTFRATDVNDLLTNGLGTFLGWKLAACLIRKAPAVRNMANHNRVGELYALLLITFAIMFFVHPYLSAAIWDRLL